MRKKGGIEIKKIGMRFVCFLMGTFEMKAITLKGRIHRSGLKMH